MKRNQKVGAIGVLLLCLFALWLGSLDRSHSTQSAKLETTPKNEPATVGGHASSRSPDHPSSTFHRGARTLVPRFEGIPALSTGFDAAPSRHPRRLNSGGSGPLDRRPPHNPDSDQIRRALSERPDRALAAAEQCLNGWAEQDDTLDSGVMLAFTVDARGLQEVWIKDRQGVPSGPLACIANAVYPIDWSGVTDKQLEITVPIRYEARDAG